MRTRRFPESNYSAIFINGKTLRIPIDASKPITELRFPEFYDLSFGNRCSGGCYKYCYAGATKTGVHYERLADKIESFFGRMDENSRPFQVAIGGEQEPLENPGIWKAIQTLSELGIIPNYTTNGMFVDDEAIELTKKYCGGVAVTLHMHLEKFWRCALKRFAAAGVKLNIHIIISDKESIDFCEQMYKEYADTKMVDYFVLLSYMNFGHAVNNPKTINTEYFVKWVDTIYDQGKLAFGANFFNLLKKYQSRYRVSLYPPEIFSKYLIMNDKMEVCNNSFDKRSVNFKQDEGCELGFARTEFLTF